MSIVRVGLLYMNILDATKLQAFSLARLQLDNMLSDDLQQAVWDVGQSIALRNYTKAIAEIDRLTSQYDCLRQPFQAALKELYKQYQLRLGQFGRAEASINREAFGSSPAPDPFLEKAQLPSGAWEAIVTEILTANDPKVAAKESIKRTTTQLPTYDSLEFPLVFLDLLKRELSSLDTEMIIILGALEKQLLTVEDLAYAVGMPVERARAIVHELWKDGYIDSKKSNLLEKIASVFKSKPADPNVKNDASFNVTTKGHFLLHPIVKNKQRAGVGR